MAEDHHKPSYIGPLIRLCQRKGKAAWLVDTQLISLWLGKRWKEACGFPDRHLMEQTREKCPHILALANIRIALRAWWEDAGDITRLLLAATADSFARQGAIMSDTITLHTRILLTTQDLYCKEISHGGSSGVGNTRKDRWKRNMAEVVSCSRQGRISVL